MAITYDDSLPDDLSKVRFNIGDTQQGAGPRPFDRNFSDNEINAMLTQQGAVDKCTAQLFDVLATEWAKYAVSFTMGPRKEELHRISSRYESKSREWAQLAGMTDISFASAFVRKDADA